MSEQRKLLLHPNDKTLRLYYSPKLMPAFPDVEEMSVWVPRELADEQVTLEIYLAHLERQLIQELEDLVGRANRPRQRVLDSKVQLAEDNLTGMIQAWDWMPNQDEKDLVQMILQSPQGYMSQQMWQERLDGVRAYEPDDLSQEDPNELIQPALHRNIEGLIYLLAENESALMQDR